MPRSPRVVIPGCPHHLTQRGNNRQDIFFDDDDRRRFLRWLADAAGQFGLTVQAYCLMTNHYHLVAVPAKPDSLHLTLKRVHQFHAQQVNRAHERSGRLWEDRFFSCPMDRRHHRAAVLYVERNPVRAGLAKSACQWPWSSAAVHCGQLDAFGLVDLRGWRMDGADWRRQLGLSLDEQTATQLRLATSRGRPLGGEGFVSRLERELGRRLRPLPPGRPRKSDDNPKAKAAKK